MLFFRKKGVVKVVNLLKILKEYFKGGINHLINVALHGFFWLIPIGLLGWIILWVYGKADFVAGHLFRLIGIMPKNYPILWTFVALIILFLASYIVGHFIQTRIGKWIRTILEIILTRIPGYKFIRDIVGLFNSAKEGNNSLVVMINGFSDSCYNTGLMYAVKQCVIEDYYTVVLSMTPIPNGGYEFEVHSDDIIVLGGITFNHYLAYLLAMGSKSLAEIAEVEPKKIEEYQKLTQWLVENPIIESENNSE